MKFRFHAAIALQTILIGPAFTLANWAAGGFEPFTLMLLRSVGTLPFFLAIFLLRGRFRGYKPTRQDAYDFLKLAFAAVTLSQFFYMYGIRYTTGENASLIYALTPAVALMLAVFWKRSERMTIGKAAGVALALVGVFVVFFGQGKAFDPTLMLGNGLVFLGVLLWGYYMVEGVALFQRIDSLQATSVMMMLGALLYLPFGIPLAVSEGMDFSLVPAQAWVGLASLILVNSLASYLLISYALSGLQSSQVAIYVNLQPVTAAVGAVVLANAHITWMFVFGGLLILTGIFMLNLARRRAQRLDLARAASLANQSPQPLIPGTEWLADDLLANREVNPSASDGPSPEASVQAVAQLPVALSK